MAQPVCGSVSNSCTVFCCCSVAGEQCYVHGIIFNILVGIKLG